MADKKKRSDKPVDPKSLMMTTGSGWPQLKKKERQQLTTFCETYRQFMSDVKTEREAHDAGLALAEAAGYVDIEERQKDATPLAPGEKVYRSVAGKTLILMHAGKEPVSAGLRIVGGHTDSPRLDLKPRPLYEDGGMALFDTHYYGGVKKYQWVTIPLALHGVVALKSGKLVPVCIGEDLNDPVLVITDLLPHLGKDQGQQKLAEAISGEGLNVLVGSQPLDDAEGGNTIKQNILSLLHERYGIDETDLSSAELEIVPAGPARDLGLDRSMILAYGHDDRVSAYTALRGILDLEKTPTYTAMCILCDKEEIGSVGSTGMDSHIFENTVAELLSLAEEPYSDLTLRRTLRRSKLLSADVNALHDPNYPEVSSPNNNMARLNHGLVVTKYVGARGKSGSNDARAEYMAQLRTLFDDAGVVWQTGEIGKVDQGGGGTIAYMLARYEIDTVDCGIGLLSMHAPWEAAGKLDIYMAYKGYKAFYGLV